MNWKIVDSIMALFRVDFSGRGELSERQQKVIYYRRVFHRASYLLASSQLAQVRFLVVGRCNALTNNGADALQVVKNFRRIQCKSNTLKGD
jgi:hypothetical protein